MYVTTDYVYGMAGITSTEVDSTAVENAILAAEGVVDRLTNTTYWSVENSGTASSSTDSTIVDSTQGWTPNIYINDYVWIYSGTGSGQMRTITDNDGTSLTVEEDWDTNPDTTSKYRIIHSGTNAHIENELRDGDNTNEIFTNNYPLQILEAVEIDSIEVTPSKIYQYKESGKLMLKSTAEAQVFTNKDAQLTSLTYWFGVYPISQLVKRLTGIYASLFILQTQMGTTHNIPSTYSLPEGSVTIGQGYINIKGTWDTLMRNKEYLEKLVPKYVDFFA